jgi:hypothetical protein
MKNKHLHPCAKSLALGLVAAAAFTVGNSAQAALVLSIDPTAKTFFLSGTDTGTFGDGILYLEAAWVLAPGGTGDANQKLALSSGGSSTTISLNPGPIDPTVNSFVGVGGGSNRLSLALFVEKPNPAAQTVSGLGATISYAGLTANNQALLENAIGQTMPLSLGSGFDGISVVAVPEPSNSVLICGLVGAGLLLRRRER